MQLIVSLKKFLKIPEFIKIFEIFEPILNHLTLPNLEYNSQQQFLDNFNEFLDQELTLNKILKFQLAFKYLLLNSYIQDTLEVHDLIRNIFLNRIPAKSPNCLIDCGDTHGCCHGNYSIELIDYNRIISEKIFSPENFHFKNNRYRIKLKKINKEQFCSAFDIGTKQCLIHKYKPPTCSKYPLITNVYVWNKDYKQWTGSCAHGGIWTTYISPIILQGLGKFWVKTILLWEKEQEFLIKFKSKLNVNKINIGKKYLAININNINNQNSVINLLSEDFPKNEVIQVLDLINL